MDVSSEMPKRNKWDLVDWTKQDGEIALLMGVSKARVHFVRHERKKALSKDHGYMRLNVKPFSWSQFPPLE